jgi:hypothetical protein
VAQACVKNLTFLSVKIEKSTRKCALVFKKKSLLTSGLGSGRMARLVQLGYEPSLAWVTTVTRAKRV